MTRRREPEWEDDRPLDEYEAEAFMRKADRRAKKAQRIFEKYLGEPDADQKIAREMGWTHLNQPMPAEADIAPDEAPPDDFEHHPLYRKGRRFTSYVLRVLRMYGRRGRKCTDELASWSTILGAKLAVGVGRIGDEEIGFSIAYLKRALRASHRALQALRQLRVKGLLPEKAIERVTARLIDLRDDIVGEVMSLRREWDAKFGS
jgi:hypothetical protein